MDWITELRNHLDDNLEACSFVGLLIDEVIHWRQILPGTTALDPVHAERLRQMIIEFRKEI